MLNWRVVPIERWPGRATPPGARKRDRFGRNQRGVDWTATQKQLERELTLLGAKNILLQMHVTQRDCRNDGWIRADARPSGPGVIITFDSARLKRPFSYPCDTYDDWQANVRAIALSLEALRAVDRHGVTQRGEQYEGFARLPPAGGTDLKMSPREAATVLVNAEALDGDVDMVLEHEDAFRLTYRAAAKRTHPDAGGVTHEFQRVEMAKRVLEEHFRSNGHA